MLVTRCQARTLHQVEPLREVELAGNARCLMRICDRNSNSYIIIFFHYYKRGITCCPDLFI
ncbi:hypothetical protein DMH88_16955 [Escherichia coli]|nr:hypothetical protein [Escherichia coli]